MRLFVSVCVCVYGLCESFGCVTHFVGIHGATPGDLLLPTLLLYRYYYYAFAMAWFYSFGLAVIFQHHRCSHVMSKCFTLPVSCLQNRVICKIVQVVCIWQTFVSELVIFILILYEITMDSRVRNQFYFYFAAESTIWALTTGFLQFIPVCL